MSYQGELESSFSKRWIHMCHVTPQCDSMQATVPCEKSACMNVAIPCRPRFHVRHRHV